MPKDDKFRASDVLKNPLEVQTAAKIMTLAWAEVVADREDPYHPTQEELAEEFAKADVFQKQLWTMMEAYAQLRMTGEIPDTDAPVFVGGEKMIKALRSHWREMWLASALADVETDGNHDERFL